MCKTSQVKLFIENFLTKSTALNCSVLLSSIGIDTTLKSATISDGNFSLTVAKNCVPYYKMIIFISAVISFPSMLCEKITGCLGRVFVIYFINVIRISILFLVGKYFNYNFDIIHEQVVQAFFIVIMALLWIFWISKTSKNQQ